MRSLIDILAMPLVVTIMQKAEAEIKQHTGVQVTLSADVHKPDCKNEYEILKEVICKNLGVAWEDVEGHDRYAELVLAREYYTWISHGILKMSQIKIGKQLRKDRTTIIHYLQKVREYSDKAKHKESELKYITTQFMQTISYEADKN